MAIESFQGDYRWLSNFWPADVEYEGLSYPTVEHAYQAAKFAAESGLRQEIRGHPSPGRAKRTARSFADMILPDFNDRKVNVMEGLLRQKFALPHLRGLLEATGGEQIVEGNTWGDVFWGVCKGKGQNRLGQLLMKIREEIRNA
jgi:ribA/ribD-fused uncharacterized protein